MTPIKFIKITRDQLDSIPIVYGNLIYCSDIRETFYDYYREVRGAINCEVLANEGMRVAIPENKIRYDTLYYVELTDKYYIVSVFSSTFIEVKYAEQIAQISGEILRLHQGFLHSPTRYFAPYTVSDSVIMADSLDCDEEPCTLQDYINDGRISKDGFGVGLRTSVKSIVIEEPDNMVMIDYPVEGYVQSGFNFLLFRNSMFIPSVEYIINEDHLILLDEHDYFDTGDVITFIFIYSVITNPGNSLLFIDGDRIDDGSISPAKFSDSIIKLTKNGERFYTGDIEGLNNYFHGLKLTVYSEDPNTVLDPVLNINRIGEIPIELNETEEVPLGLLHGVVTLMYDKERKFKIISSNNGNKYTIKHLDNVEDPIEDVYRLIKDEVAIGDPIVVPKLVSDGSVKYCTKAGEPIDSLRVGDPYIELSINAENKLYIPVPSATNLMITLQSSGDGNGISSIECENNIIKVKKDIKYLTSEDENEFLSSKIKIGGVPIDKGLTKEELNALIDTVHTSHPLKISNLEFDGRHEVIVTSKTISDLASHQPSVTTKTYPICADEYGMYTYAGIYIDTDGKLHCNDTKGNKTDVLLRHKVKTEGEFYTGNAVPAATNRLNYDGYLYMTRAFTAVFNDYAELFEKAYPEEEFEPGDVIVKAPGKRGYTKSYKSSDSLVVGVVSNQYGYLVGGTGNEKYDKTHYIPVGLAGRNTTRVYGLPQEGDLLVSYRDGLAITSRNKIDDIGSIFGKILNVEYYDEERNISTVEFLIMNR